MIRKSLLIEGLESSERIHALTNVLSAIPGARGIKISSDENKATVTVPDIIDDATIIAVISRLNCKVVSILEEIRQ